MEVLQSTHPVTISMKNGLVLIGRTMPVLTRHALSHGRKTIVFLKGSFTHLNLFNSKRGAGGEK